jgi:hypothetical protein
MIDLRVAEISAECMIDFEVGGGVARAGSGAKERCLIGRSYGVGVETPKYLPYPVPTA